ncbi:biotin--[acetyl-CoA-carboxylase] ligase [Aestuariispira insulae]|uniref:biotin--[biotin carboxyl-carrier protein] ligase n=1 Tax=Aestuariispira insulae TaxID=1461337 RepID=A0A3D9HWM6_9PROT|nr:biotin--[acetyl-CoA-carboxylase] ligase [Aestuariispira insulae]RED53316.1 BirA family biotin operon repressor/biotin-[acetyl-CoA-carboxylase] ligase [Aestuariispira insulae]
MHNHAPEMPAGFTLRAFESVGSTNDVARELSSDPSYGNIVVWADSQCEGRGRSGRVWTSPAGNLYNTVLIRDVGALAQAASLSLVAAVAMGEAVARFLPDSGGLGYKWPNDLLFDRAKFCGILLESGQALGNNWVMIGSGVNLVRHPEDTPYPATNLKALGADVGAAVLLQAYVERLDHWIGRWRQSGIAAVRDAWLSRAVGLGEKIQARLADGQVLEGMFRDLDAHGVLILDVPGKGTRVISAGDVFFP